MNIFISGGAKNGKSYYAQKRAKAMAEELGLPLYYVATMIPSDHEDLERIARHLRERDGWGFTTIEEPYRLCRILEDNSEGVFLVDSVTAILANKMFDIHNDYKYNENAVTETSKDLSEFATKTQNVIFVSDYIYGDPRPLDNIDYTEEYRYGLAYVDRKLANRCQEVIEISAGIPTYHKRTIDK